MLLLPMTEISDLGEAHPSLPAPYVEFVRQLWRTQKTRSRHSWSRKPVLARKSVFSSLLASERLGTELRRVYETSVGPQIAKALTRQAVHIPRLWMSEDKRTKKEKAAQFRNIKTVIKAVSGLLDRDRSVVTAENHGARLSEV